MIIGYRPQFEQPILNGTKIHTIRRDPLNRWQPGKIMHMATGVRTKAYRMFKKDTCKSKQRFEIRHNRGGGVNVFIDGKFFYHQTSWGLPWDEGTRAQMLQLARNDGFNSIAEFFAWFNTPFKGYIIHWTEFKY